MRNKLFIIAILIVLIAAGLFLFFARGNKDILRIRKDLNTIASLVEKEKGEPLMTSFSKMQKLASFFTQDCSIKIGSPVPEIKNKDELISTASQLRQMAESIKIQLSEISVTLQDNTHAKSNFVAAAFVDSSLLNKGDIYPRQLELTWEKFGRYWKIRQVGVIEILH